MSKVQRDIRRKLLAATVNSPFVATENCTLSGFLGRKPALRREVPSILRRIPRASKLLICGLFQKGRVLAQDGFRRSGSAPMKS